MVVAKHGKNYPSISLKQDPDNFIQAIALAFPLPP